RGGRLAPNWSGTSARGAGLQSRRQGKEPMSTTRLLRGGIAGLALLAGALLASPALGQNCDCCKGPCPPFVKYRYEAPPRLCFKPGCPKPICDPCHLPHYGYYPVCWQ